MFTRREYMLVKLSATSSGTINIFMAAEAIASVALAHPEWDMDETKTLAQWNAAGRAAREDRFTSTEYENRRGMAHE